MALTKEDAHWRVDLVTPENYRFGERPKNIPIAWFLRRWQAEQYVELTSDRGHRVVVNENMPQPSEQSVRVQEAWIEEHGGDLAGYINRYGDPDLDKCYGNGGTAIYKADVSELHRLHAGASRSEWNAFHP